MFTCDSETLLTSLRSTTTTMTTRRGNRKEWDRWLEHKDVRVGAKGPNGQPNATRGAEGGKGGREIRQPVRVHSTPHPLFLCFLYVLLTVPISSTHAPTCRTRKTCTLCASFLFAAYLPPPSTNTTPPCTKHQRRDTVSHLWCLVHHCSAHTLQTRPRPHLPDKKDAQSVRVFLVRCLSFPPSTNTTPPCTEHQRHDTVSRLWCLVHHCSACTLQRQETRPYGRVSCSWASLSPSMKNLAYIGYVFCVGHLTPPPHLPKTGNVPNVVHFRCSACLYPPKTRNTTPLGRVFHVWRSSPSINSYLSYLLYIIISKSNTI